VTATRKQQIAVRVAVLIYLPFVCPAAEHYVFDVFNQEQGLGNSTVTRLALDGQGALWVGTENGLYRYDGHRFLAFSSNDGLPGNKITAIHESPDGTLWVGTLEGLAWREGAGFRKSSNTAFKEYITPQGIASDATGRVFVATLRGVALTSAPKPGKDLQVTFLPWPEGIPRRSSNVYVSSPDEIWFDCDVAICRWNGHDVRVWGRDAGVPPYHWDLFLKDKAGNLWARNRNYFIELPAGTTHFRPAGPDAPGPISIPPELTMDDKGRILVPDNRGLVIGAPGNWRRITERQGLPENLITAVLQDREGSVWVGTYGSGLARWAGYDAWRGFTVMEGLAGNDVTALLEDPPSGMWVGTTGGLSHGVLSKGTWNWSDIAIPGLGWVTSLTRTKDGVLWMTTGDHFVVRYDPVSRSSRRLGPFGEGPFQIRADGAGKLWIADSDRVVVGSAPNRMQDFEALVPPGTPERVRFTATAEDARGDLWIGSMSGLFRRSQGKWFRYDTASGLSANRIVDLALSPEGDIWLTYFETIGTDRVRATGNSIQVEHFDRSKGLTSDRVNSIGFDLQGRIWILNDRGVQIRRGNTWAQLSRADGMISSGANGRAFCASADGAIWIGGERGLSRYVPVEKAGTPLESGPLRVRFSEVRIGDRVFDPGASSIIQDRPQAFEAKFSVLLLAHGPEVCYRYRILGLGDQWQETSRAEVRLDFPHPGRYRLEVQARRDGQLWSEPAAVLGLEIRPRWYETSLFRGTLVALVCATLGFLTRLYRKASAAREALKRKVARRTAELMESEERFRNMADTAPVLIWISGPDRLFTFFNKTWHDFTGSSNDQDLRTNWTMGVHPADLDRCVATYDSAFDARQSFQTEFRRRRSDGEFRWLLCSGAPRLTAGGDFTGYVGSEIDITDVKRAQEEVVSRQKLESLGVLTSGIAHDFNNLLASILMDTELADSDLASRNLAKNSPPRQELKRIKAVAIRASEIVRELMIYSGQDRSDLEPLDLSQLVDEMLELLKVSISKNAVLEADLAGDLPMVMGNAAQIRQIVMNLIINSSEAIGAKDGEIRVSTSSVTVGEGSTAENPANLPAGNYVRLEISDTGCGMTEALQVKVFDPFFSTKFVGRGLGLAVVQGIVRTHGGGIYLKSAPGRGTTFQIFLPLGAASPQQTSRASIQAPLELPERSEETILLVEDEESLRLPVAKLLRKQGWGVIEAANGQIAAELFGAHQHEIDVILLDMTIPGRSSREIIEETVRLRPEIKIILMSAYPREVAANSLDAPQIRGFLRKPFQLSDLFRLLQNISAFKAGAD
jgi:PAS domain S-box-containing protein